MAKVSTPVDGFNGEVAGVAFINGAGETDDQNALAYFRRHGYDIAEPTTRRASTKPDSKTDSKTDSKSEK